MKTKTPEGQALNKRLNDAYSLISEETILQMAKNDLPITNVVNGLNLECFCLLSQENKFSPKYTLIYINGKEQLQGDAVQLNLNDKDNFDITFAFCNHLATEYTHLDLLDTFNAYNRQLRSYVEFFGYLAITDHLLEQFDEYNYDIITKEKGVIYIPQIEKVKFYRNFFDNTFTQPKPAGENVVYLLLDLNSGYIKIGRSSTMSHREKTLQAQAPAIETIAFWKAPKRTETQLHKMFDAKRTRGEWFNLTFSEMNQIKILMKEYK